MPDGGVVRVGTLSVLITAQHRRYLDAIETHLHARLQPIEVLAGRPPDLQLDITEDAQPVARAEIEDPLEVQSAGGHHTVSTRLMQAELDTTAQPHRCHVRSHPEGQAEEHLLVYFVVVLNKVLQLLGRVRLHAAAAVVGDRTALFVGDKGAGKSTLSLALGRLGATVLGDDQVVLEYHDERPAVAGSDDRVRMTVQTERHFFDEPVEGEPFDSGGVPKKQVALADVVPAAAPFLAHPLTDLFFPRVDEAFAIHPLGRGAALGLLLAPQLPQQRFTDDADRLGFIDLLAGAVEAARCHELVLSRDIDDLARLYAYLDPPR